MSDILVRVINAEGPPVPIPNTEVKLCRADNTCMATCREDRYARTLHHSFCGAFFVKYIKYKLRQQNTRTGPVASAPQQNKQNKKAHKSKGGAKSILFVYLHKYFQQIKLLKQQIKLRQNARFPVYCKVYGYCTQMPGEKLCLRLPLST